MDESEWVKAFLAPSNSAGTRKAKLRLPVQIGSGGASAIKNCATINFPNLQIFLYLRYWHGAKNFLNFTLDMIKSFGDDKTRKLFLGKSRTGELPDEIIDRALQDLFDLDVATILKDVGMMWGKR